MRLIVAAGVFGALLAAGCQSSSVGSSDTGGKSAALRAMEPIAIAAYRCWFEGGDDAFADYSFANELDSYSGRPRFLIVPEDNFAGRPLLVVQAEGPAGDVSAFGPLLSEPAGARIRADLARWQAGGTACGETA